MGMGRLADFALRELMLLGLGAPIFSTQDQTFYVAGVSGLDTNTGLTAGSPKKTLDGTMGLFSVMPGVFRHNIAIDMGNEALSISAATVAKFILIRGGKFVTTGGSTFTVLSGPHTATSSLVTSITKAAAGFSSDAFKGELIRIKTGPASGDIRTVRANTADTVFPTKAFSAAPGLADFEIIESDGKIVGTGTLEIRCIGSEDAPIEINRLGTGGTARLDLLSTGCLTTLVGVSLKSTASRVLDHQGTGKVQCGQDGFTDPAASFALDTTLQGGVGQTVTAGEMRTKKGQLFNFERSAGETLRAEDRSEALVALGSRLTQLLGKKSDLVLDDDPVDGIATTIDGPGNGIEADGCDVRFDGVVGGTSTGGGSVGFNPHGGTTASVKTGATPMLTGAAGDILVHGTIGAAPPVITWGTALPSLFDTSEGVLIREVP